MRLVTIATAAAVAIALAGCTSSTPTAKAAADNGRTLPEQLTFTGAIKGHLTVGLNAQGVLHTQSAPMPNSGGGMFLQTSCADYHLGSQDDPSRTHEWEANIYGEINGQAVTLRLSYEDDNIVGKHDLDSRGGSAFPGNVQPFIDVQNGVQFYYPIYPSSIKINSDMHSGTLRLDATDAPSSDPKVHVTGTWRCA
ncbi:hypothetical protein [Streptomyces sp. NPDC052036]|uniref:hypothetical protein n=1 Tax=Streptomyces sp. NPDC052036 TaxID=3155171 RepID=UPI0034285797